MRTVVRVPLSSVLPVWFHTPLLPAPVAKEVRTLLPAWVLAWFVPTAVLVWAHGDPGMLSYGTYFVLCGVLGGTILGTEFSHRTISLLLSQPVPRTEIWQRKMLVLAGALLTAAIPPLCALSLSESLKLVVSFALVLAPALNAFCLGPWLSLLARSALAGTVFSLLMPVLLMAAIRWTTGYLYWTEVAQFNIFAGTALVCWICAAVLGYRKFRHLEANDARAAEVHWPGWGAARPAKTVIRIRPGGWFGTLLRKELRLQQVSFFLALAFWGIWWGYALTARDPSVTIREFLGASTQGYMVVLALLIGSLTCAEERQMATLPLQLTSPVKTWVQWWIKAGVALVLSLALAAVLPMAMLQTPWLEAAHADLPWAWPDSFIFALMIVALTAVAIYVSSFSASTVRAFLTAGVAALALGGLAAAIAFSARAQIGQVASFVFWQFTLEPLRMSFGSEAALLGMTAAASAVTLGLLLVMGQENFRRGDVSTLRVLVHTLIVTVLFGLTASLWAFLSYLG
jgi:hypothetical protein